MISEMWQFQGIIKDWGVAVELSSELDLREVLSKVEVGMLCR